MGISERRDQPGRGTSMGKGPEVGSCLACWMLEHSEQGGGARWQASPRSRTEWSRAHLSTTPPPHSQEVALSGLELPGTVESVEEALKRHRDFLTTMELNQQKMQVAVQAAEGLLRQGNAYGEQAQEAVTRLLEK